MYLFLGTESLMNSIFLSQKNKINIFIDTTDFSKENYMEKKVPLAERVESRSTNTSYLTNALRVLVTQMLFEHITT